jgi:hypothetical protein
MEVIGYDLDGQEIYDTDLSGDVMGDVMGVGKARAPKGGHRLARIPNRPNWRNQLAPGVIQPDEGMVPLPLVGQSGSPAGTFNSGISTITFQGQLQKPYRPERLLASTVRTGTSAVGRLLGVLYVGTDLQQAEINGWDVELIGAATAFGTRLTCKAAEPGVFVRLVVTLSAALSGTDTIYANLTWLGRVIH